MKINYSKYLFTKINSSKDNHPFFASFRSTFKIDDHKILQKLQEPFILRQINNNFKILPFLLDENHIQEFRKHIHTNIQFQNLILNWFSQPLVTQSAWLQSDNQFLKFSSNQLPILYPFIQLFRLFLLEQKPLQFAISTKLSQLTDLRHPHLLYPEARQIKRNIYYHHGPTNSGKTYYSIIEIKNKIKENQDLNNLIAIYCAPLRLLAFEVQTLINNDFQIPVCQLITGQEKNYIEHAKATSCTIEAADLNKDYEIAIIDEIQMISDPERGNAWTSAFLGLKAKEIHICGDSRALNLIQNLCQFTGDKLQEIKYTRLSKLILGGILNPFKDLQPGDCLVAFNVKQLHELRYIIEKKFGPCAIIYGKLPPINRKQQASQFNQWSENGKVKYLVATNAIGMGLNLKIKRIIFTSVFRRMKSKLKRIDDWEILQIAGRAGRQENNGKVYAMNRRDLKIIKGAFEVQNSYNIEFEERFEDKEDIYLDEQQKEETPIIKQQIDENEEDIILSNDIGRQLTSYEKQISKAAIFPNFQYLKNFQIQLENAEGKKCPLAQVFKKFCSISQLQNYYFIKRADTFYLLCDAIEDLNMNLKDQYNWSLAPLNSRTKKCLSYYREFAEQFVQLNCVQFKVKESFEIICKKKEKEQLEDLEELYQICDLYTWLWGKYENQFVNREEVGLYQSKIEQKIGELLCQY